MPCFHPVSAFQPLEGGKLVFRERRDCRSVTIACGQCIGCRLQRSQTWALRIMHESRMHSASCFITLTYSDDFLPSDLSLRYSDFQLFFKRLRKRFSGSNIRFYMCGEYGENFSRPHFHACVFGFDFPDKLVFRKSPSGFMLYESKTLSDIWGKGFCSVADLTFESAAYVARYVCKKITGSNAEEHYSRVDSITGEIYSLVPEFARMSLKPGIGATFVEKYHDDIVSGDSCVHEGRKLRVPRYYDQFQNRVGSDLGPESLKIRDQMADEFMEDLKFRRGLKADLHVSDGTPERLAVREQVTLSNFSRLKRRI